MHENRGGRQGFLEPYVTGTTAIFFKYFLHVGKNFLIFSTLQSLGR